MKVMYVACNPQGQEDLTTELETTELQSAFLDIEGEPVKFAAYPKLAFEELSLTIMRQAPDILHISAHGAANKLMMAQADGEPVSLTAELLATILNFENPPLLVYLSACNSQQIAYHLAVKRKVVRAAIGTTAPITNRAARAAARTFYHRLLHGLTVQNAFEAATAQLKGLDKASAKIFPAKGAILLQTMHKIPRIVAKFTEMGHIPDKEHFYTVLFGIAGCPRNTVHVVFFTDDLTILPKGKVFVNKEVQLAVDSCRVVRPSKESMQIWSECPEYIPRDYRLFATGVTLSGDFFTVKSTACDALAAYAESTGSTTKAARNAIAKLREGSDE